MTLDPEIILASCIGVLLINIVAIALYIVSDIHPSEWTPEDWKFARAVLDVFTVAVGLGAIGR